MRASYRPIEAIWSWSTSVCGLRRGELPLINRYENLLVVQTSRSPGQLAGARLGLAMGNAKLIADLNQVKFSLNPYNINRLTLKAGRAAAEDTASSTPPHRHRRTRS